jgi:hypothetical protein
MFDLQVFFLIFVAILEDCADDMSCVEEVEEGACSAIRIIWEFEYEKSSNFMFIYCDGCGCVGSK